MPDPVLGTIASVEPTPDGPVLILMDTPSGVPWRCVLNIGDDLVNWPEDVQDMCINHWSDPEVAARWAAILAQVEAENQEMLSG